jgi:hypothetical protein
MQPILIPPSRPVHEGEVVDLRTPPPQDPALAMLQLVSLVMDRLFQVPGTQLRFGVNSLLMVVPVLGNVIPSLVSFSIVAVGLKNYRVPRIVAARMMFNSLLDASIGWIPGVGDAFDLFFKADTRNVRLLEQYMRPDNQQPPTWGHWLFLGSLALVAIAVLVLVAIGATTVGMALFRNVQGGP